MFKEEKGQCGWSREGEGERGKKGGCGGGQGLTLWAPWTMGGPPSVNTECRTAPAIENYPPQVSVAPSLRRLGLTRLAAGW